MPEKQNSFKYETEKLLKICPTQYLALGEEQLPPSCKPFYKYGHMGGKKKMGQ